MEVSTFQIFRLDFLLFFCLIHVTHLNVISFSSSVLAQNQYLSMDPTVAGVFTSPYPFGIDPV